MPKTTISKLFGSALGVFTGDKQEILKALFGGLEKAEKMMVRRKLYTILEISEILGISEYRTRKWLNLKNADFVNYKRKNHYLKITMDALIAEKIKELENARANEGLDKRT